MNTESNKTCRLFYEINNVEWQFTSTLYTVWHFLNQMKKAKAQVLWAQIEHFQNQFIREKEVIDILKHKLKVSEKQLANFVKELCVSGFESIRMDNHSKLREDVFTFRKIFKELKEEFRRFEADCMLGVYA